MCLTCFLCKSALPVSFGLHDIGALSFQLLQSLSDNCLLLVSILLKHNVNGENTKPISHYSLNVQYFTCGRLCVRCLSLSVCFRPSRSSSAFLFCMIDRRSWTWQTNSVRLTPPLSLTHDDLNSFSAPLSTFTRWIGGRNTYCVLLSLTLSSCLSLSLFCLRSTFLCMSTRLRIVLSLSIADTSLACSLCITVDSLSAGLQSAFTTGNNVLVAL